MSGSSSKLEVRLLGPLEVRHEGEPLDLPRSKKTRALLAYLAATGREHTRNQLCTLLWDSTDDPRGALRWSLSKLRPLVNEDMERLSADRERVSFSAPDTLIDLREIERMVRRGVSSLSTDDLERGAALGRGEFLEAFELPDLFEFQSWCLAQREEARQQRCSILTELVDRLAGSPERALPWARELVQANPLDVAPRRVLFKLLFKLDRASEAEQQFEVATRLFRELDAPGIDQLHSSWNELQEHSSGRARRSQEDSKSIHPASDPAIVSTPGPDRPDLVGRDAELATLRAAVDASRTDGKLTLNLLFGEPGVGKSRLADSLADAAAQSGVTVLRGRSYEAERLYPFGPWVDALGTPVSNLIGTTRTEKAESRETLFQSIARRLAAKAREHSPVLLIFDDIQWIDPDSAELLHYVVRTTEAVPLGLLLIARTGEIEDNEASTSLLRGIRRVIAPSELELRPLSLEETTELIGETEGDPRAIWEASAGNPLYALELARALDQGGASGSLARVVRERIARLPAAAGDLLRWGSVLGHTFAVSRLETLSSLGTKELIEALEGLEVHAL
ncbi:MAG: AAA family ATPase, partial [Thermoanaerobaculia bacterium]|nr:AAA family ATPase [Thermoanaerobaculia bacterium]